MKKVFLLLLILNFGLAFSQRDSIGNSKLIQTDRLKMEYIDFGGYGVPLINVQGIHNFFGNHKGYEDSKKSYIQFLKSFTENNRVLAPVSRGYGKSENTQYGFDVATQAEDLISLMDALGIKKAVFLGRLTASQAMIYLAEHHPERILGLIFYDMTLVLPDLTNSDITEFLKHDSYGATDQGEDPWSRLGPRHIHKPHLYDNPDIQFEIPALWFYFSGINDPDKSIYLRRLSNAEKSASYNWKNSKIENYYQDLISDPERWEMMKQYLVEHNPNSKTNQALKRSFGEKLSIVNEDLYEDMSFEELEEKIRIPKIKAFLKEIDQEQY